MPNGADKLLNFTLKVWDDTAKAYRPVYIAPDATNAIQGDVKLSDAVNSTLDAASGMTAATPKAVKTVQDSANNKLDKTTGSDQTVASKVTFSNSIIANKGVTVPTGQFFTGNLSGNATTATTLQTSRRIALTGRVTGSANFNGGADASIATTIAAGSITGTDLADNSITSAKIVDGTIASADVGFNYAGSSSKGGAATSAAKLTTARTITLTGDVTGSASFDGSTNVSLTSTLGAGVVGTNELAANAVTSAKIADGTIVAGDIANATITGAKIANATITATQLANNAVTTAKLADSSVNSAKIVNGSVTGTDIAANTVSLTNLAEDVGTTAVQSSQPTDNNVVLWVQI